MNPKDIDIVILNGLTPQYDAEVRMLESSSDCSTREWIERAVINQYERLESEKSTSATAPATPTSQHGGFLGSVRTNLGSLAATSARPALAARGAPRERPENEY